MERNITIIKAVALAVVFMATVLFTFFSLDARQDDEMYTNFESSTIPVLYMKTEAGNLINPADGYVTDVGERNVFNGITPLYEDRSLNICFYNNGTKIVSLSYRLRDVETDQLLEDTQVKNLVSNEEQAEATLNIKNLIEKDREYLLTFVVKTDRNQEVHYYERIIWSDGLKTDEKLQFALNFNSYTYSKDNLSNISKWIETDESGDNTNFGKVNIHSTRAQIGWGSLSPRIEGNVIPTIWEINGITAQISLRYKVVTYSGSTEFEAYSVKDYYRLHQTSETIYLMDYEREADQIFDAYGDLQNSGRINLGIKSSLTDIEAMADATGKYSFFVQNGSLWCYSRSENKFTDVFSFSASSDYTGQESNDLHEIKLIQVDSNGNAWFSVMGLMKGGGHDGKVGISLFQYNYADNIVKEKVFIPVNAPYHMLLGNTGDVSYVSGDIYYVKINQYLYSIDLVSGEYMLIAQGLYDETYAVNATGNRIAYHDNHADEGNHVIRIYDFEQKTEKVIKGSDYGNGTDADYLKIVGYIGDDLLYGLINEDDVIVEEQINSIFPMYEIVVLDDEYTVKKIYSEAGKYVYEAEIDGMRVNLWRVQKTEDGRYESTSIDQLLNKEENTNSSIFTEVVTTSTREKELYLNIPTSSGDLQNVAVRYAKEIQFQDSEFVTLESDYVFNSVYNVYGHGKWLGKYTSIRNAIMQASGNYGYVIGADGNYVWKKTEGNKTVNWNHEEEIPVIMNYEYNLSGLGLDYVLYYVSEGKLVAGMLGDGKYVYIYEYDNNNIKYYDMELKTDVTLDRNTASKKFIQWNNIFVVLE